jgi:hypothetical protein
MAERSMGRADARMIHDDSAGGPRVLDHPHRGHDAVQVTTGVPEWRDLVLARPARVGREHDRRRATVLLDDVRAVEDQGVPHPYPDRREPAGHRRAARNAGAGADRDGPAPPRPATAGGTWPLDCLDPSRE